MRQEFLAHSDTVICDRKLKCRLVIELYRSLDIKRDISAFRSELNRITENIDENLSEFHVITDIVVIDLALDIAAVVLVLSKALTAEHCIDRLEHLRE